MNAKIAQRRTKLAHLAILWSLAAGLAACGQSETKPAQTEAEPPGSTWASIAKLPDWSGAWAIDGQSFMRQVGVSAGRGTGADAPPFTPEYHAMMLANGAANGGQGPEGGVVTNSVNCIPDGMPGIMVAPLSFEVLYTPNRVTFIFESGEVRRIYTDGRKHPPAEELDPTFSGHSIGHWEGDVLVVDTVGMVPEAMLFVGLHITGNTHVSERVFRKDARTMQIDTVVTDPAIFTEPYNYTRTFEQADIGIGEYVCTQNNRDTNLEIDLTPPPSS